jgi:hypothetical protein
MEITRSLAARIQATLALSNSQEAIARFSVPTATSLRTQHHIVVANAQFG